MVGTNGFSVVAIGGRSEDTLKHRNKVRDALNFCKRGIRASSEALQLNDQVSEPLFEV